MSRHIGKLVLGITALIAVIVFAATAEIGEEDPCRQACQDTHVLCVNECSAHSNPMECERTCDRQRDECRTDC